jgi:sugar transferase (PEP-CTERM/EpsH1 system associated)
MTASCKELERQTNVAEARSLRVVHVVLSLDCGGLEHVVLDLVRGGLEIGQKVSVICLEHKGVLAEQLEAAGVAVHSCEKRPGLHIRKLRRSLRRRFVEIRPDVVHTHQIGALFYAGPAAKSVGSPVVAHTEHGKHFEHRAKTRWLGRYASRFADCFFCVSKDIADDVVRRRIAPAQRVEFVPNGIDTVRFGAPVAAAAIRAELGIPSQAHVVGTIGRLAEIKRQDLLIRAFAVLKAELPEAHLLIVGDGPERRSLEELTHALGVSDSVCFAGYREDRERLLHAMNVFALTSRSEGMPLSVLEAWAAGVPVLAANVGGLPDLIEEGRTGRLIDSSDPDTWARAILILLDDSESAASMSAAAKAHVEQFFSRSAMTQAYARRYRALLGTPASQ